jgi:hypothetical protein
MGVVEIVDVRTFLRSWIIQILNTEGGESLPVIASHQNAPRPTDGSPYIVLERSPGRTRIGRSYATVADALGNQSLYEDWEDVWVLEEVNGEGDRVARLLESTERQDIISLFAGNGTAYLGQASPINALREQENDRWYYRHTVEIRLGIRSQTDYTPGYIETVDYDGTYEGGP